MKTFSKENLIRQIFLKKSFLCIGLDPDLSKMPKHLLQEEDPIFAFNKAIIDATQEFAVSYKPNTAFYEAYGLQGWQALERTIAYINQTYPEIFTIADAKRGDIGNTSSMYAKAFLDTLGFDSITIAPYMGKDSVEPFLEFKNKATILLALTSNEGAFNFQTIEAEKNFPLYKQVIKESLLWKNAHNLMFVIGATKAEYLKEIREIAPENFFLVPGIGAQGGNLEDVCRYGLTKDIGLLINSSRGIIYASTEKDFTEHSQREAYKIQQQMQTFF